MRFPSTAPTDDEFTLLYWDDDMALGHSDKIFFCLWRVHTTRAGVARLAAATKEFTKSRDFGCAIVTIIEPAAKVPEQSVRDGLTQLLKHQGGKVLLSALVFEGNGFKAAVVRGIVTGLIGLTRQPYPHRVFANVEEVADWFASKEGKVGSVFPAAETLRYANDFRRILTEAEEEPSDHGGRPRFSLRIPA